MPHPDDNKHVSDEPLSPTQLHACPHGAPDGRWPRGVFLSPAPHARRVGMGGACVEYHARRTQREKTTRRSTSEMRTTIENSKVTYTQEQHALFASLGKIITANPILHTYDTSPTATQTFLRRRYYTGLATPFYVQQPSIQKHVGTPNPSQLMSGPLGTRTHGVCLTAFVSFSPPPTSATIGYRPHHARVCSVYGRRGVGIHTCGVRTSSHLEHSPRSLSISPDISPPSSAEP